MTGCTKTGRTGEARVYYRCPHNPANPRHVAAVPGHPTIQVRQDHAAGLSS